MQEGKDTSAVAFLDDSTKYWVYSFLNNSQKIEYSIKFFLEPNFSFLMSWIALSFPSFVICLKSKCLVFIRHTYETFVNSHNQECRNSCKGLWIFGEVYFH